MQLPVYDSRKVFYALDKIERDLDQLIATQCPDAPLILEEGLDVAMNRFLSRYNFEGNEVSLLTTQYALMRLRSELTKAKDVVVEINDLQALQDFESSKRGKLYFALKKTSLKPVHPYITASVGLIFLLCIVYLSILVLRSN
ncbi:hypothetical protein ACFSQ3_04775 [Sphingobacterium corticis]|uniref:Uncharacterized protein n=1 Tax=Sphingobacterium corticis TaxID=1812823 RepID=A0ABW5NI63_9SPHI